jgi:hypothetical protein
MAASFRFSVSQNPPSHATWGRIPPISYIVIDGSDAAHGVIANK